ncbi:DASH complex subunit Dad1-domain-containing protein [Mrakia frigida]|uniref:DASH complex subunit DAD1 n=1 Tax=Mrakia frigida TaxID=29902 RepID=UPI003FCC2038
MDHRKSLAPSIFESTTSPSEAFDGRTEFEREQDRLINEIANDFEEVLSDANALNRRVEEATGVGSGFETIAKLWGRFGELMREAKLESESSVADTTQSSSAAGGANTSA